MAVETKWSDSVAAKTEVSQDVERRLRDVRQARGIPKERVALEMGMSAENWRHYESGRNQLAVTQLPRLAELFEMTVADLGVALLAPRDICNNPPDSDYEKNNTGNANYNYTESPGWRFEPARDRRPALALAASQ